MAFNDGPVCGRPSIYFTLAARALKCVIARVLIDRGRHFDFLSGRVMCDSVFDRNSLADNGLPRHSETARGWEGNLDDGSAQSRGNPRRSSTAYEAWLGGCRALPLLLNPTGELPS